MERSYRLLREEGFADQMEYHSPTSQYGQLSRRGRYDALDFKPIMREITEGIASGEFANEWDAEAAGGYQTLASLKDAHCGEGIKSFERDIRRRIGLGVLSPKSSG